MRIPTPIQALSAAAALALLAGCSSGSAVAPSMHNAPIQTHHVLPMNGHVPSVVGMASLIKGTTPRPGAGFNSCPATGTIEYMSDFGNSAIYIYSGNWSGQQPCGIMTNATSGLVNPQGMTVHAGDLYVANTGLQNVLVFHRGATTAYKTCTDTTNGGNYAVDVTVARDKTIIATDIFDGNGVGSISTWKYNCAFVNSYQNPTGNLDYFLTVQRNGAVFFDGSEGTVRTASCPGGTCGTFNVVSGISYGFPGGLRSSGTAGNFDNHLLLDDQSYSGGGSALDQFLPTGSVIPWNPSSDVVSFDINHTNHHVYGADAGLNEGIEMTYPGGVLKGTVPGQGGSPTLIGVAIDRPGALN